VVAGRNLAVCGRWPSASGPPGSPWSPRTGGGGAHGWGIGLEAACELAAMPADVVCVAITGAAALRPTLAAIDAGTTVATATKEVLSWPARSCAPVSRRSGARIVAIDSEHSAIWQCSGARILPASAGSSSPRAAGPPGARPGHLRRHHPRGGPPASHWNMGPKITVDCATLMNKGLEVIEAHSSSGSTTRGSRWWSIPARWSTRWWSSGRGHQGTARRPRHENPDRPGPRRRRALERGGPAADLPAVSPLQFLPLDPRRFPAVGWPAGGGAGWRRARRAQRGQ